MSLPVSLIHHEPLPASPAVQERPLHQLFTNSEAVIPLRAVHLDLKGMPPTFERLLELLDVFSRLRFNFVVVEWEDAYPWSVDPAFRSETAYTEDEVRRFCDKAAHLGLELVPLVQSLGHMENILRTSCRVHLRENADEYDVLNPLAPGAGSLVRSLLDDVLRLMPNVRYFHVGGDEAWSFGTHPDTRSFIEKHSSASLYLHHMEPILDELNGRGIRPMLWHDMLGKWEDEALRRIAPKCDLVVWGYQGHPDEIKRHYHSSIIERFHRNGFVLWGATAFKGADGIDADLPDLEKRRLNGLAWIEMAQRYEMVGLFTTGWSRYHSGSNQCESIEASLDALLMQAILFHRGKISPDQIEKLPDYLDEIGAGKRFRQCRDALELFGRHRNHAWHYVRTISQHLACLKDDPRRTPKLSYLTTMQRDLDAMEAAAKEAEAAFEGLVPPLWTARYLSERTRPLHRMAQELKTCLLETATETREHSTQNNKTAL